MHDLQFGQKEINYLSTRDPKLGEIIKQIGMLSRETYPDIFQSLVFSILGQQISTKQHIKVWEKFCLLVHEVTPENVIATAPEEIRAIGISGRKIKYIQEITDKIIHKEFFPDELWELPDAEIRDRLLALKGVGDWTVEMIMIFSLGRLDVISYKDFGIRRGMMLLYGYEELTPEQFAQHAATYSPYGTIASLYLWELAAKGDPTKLGM